MQLDLNAIKAILPHRYPFLLVDRIIELEAGKRVVGIKNVSANEGFFQGHFPGEPVMPGVLILEALAQLSCVLVLRDLGIPGSIALFTGVENVSWRRKVVPGDQLRPGSGGGQAARALRPDEGQGHRRGRIGVRGPD